MILQHEHVNWWGWVLLVLFTIGFLRVYLKEHNV